MFPPEFVRRFVEEYSKRGDLILDPFSGRGTTLLESLLLGRRAIAADINPVAYCVSAAKANTPQLDDVLAELDGLEWMYLRRYYDPPVKPALPEFFEYAFHPDTLSQLLSLKTNLNWKRKRVHRFIAALVLGHLHGEADRSEYYFSNQMPHSISTKPDYSVRYWRAHNMIPPQRDVFDILRNRAEFRLKMGRPEIWGHAALCDVRDVARVFPEQCNQVRMVLTSPPYLDVTNFEEDQWLRLWFLGGPPHPTYGQISKDDRRAGATGYWEFIRSAWRGVVPLLRNRAILICRIGAKNIEPELLMRRFIDVVTSVWPKNQMIARPSISEVKHSQISVLNPKASGCRYEMDFECAVR
jgi:hypothetical protein